MTLVRTLPLPRPRAALLALLLMVGCSQPGFIDSGDVGPAPPLLPVGEILAEANPQLDAEATAALEARAAALRDRAGLAAGGSGG